MSTQEKNYIVLDTLRLKYATIQFIRTSNSKENKTEALQIKKQLNTKLQELGQC